MNNRVGEESGPYAFAFKRGALKAFREYLNKEFAGTKHRHYAFHQKTREYGDYLYVQDRAKFVCEFEHAMLGAEHPNFDRAKWLIGAK